MTKPKVEEEILDIKQDLLDASLAYDIWRAFTDISNRDTFEVTMRLFPRYFEAVIHTSLVTVIVTCYRLFEDRRDTTNFPRLLRNLSDKYVLSDTAKMKISSLKQDVLPTWEKVAILRNNIFGHRSKKLNPQEAFQKAKITPYQLRDLIKNMQSLLNLISRKTNGRSFTFNLSAKGDIESFMVQLKKAAADTRI